MVSCGQLHNASLHSLGVDVGWQGTPGKMSKMHSLVSAAARSCIVLRYSARAEQKLAEHLGGEGSVVYSGQDALTA